MKLHPAEIAKEIRKFPFFKSFSDELLLQAATMIQPQSFPLGSVILAEGSTNKSLYFLRSGQVEITLSGQIIASLENSGDVFGEMSVITSNLVSTSIRATTAVECFVMRSQDFVYIHPKDKDLFQSLLYQIYCQILTTRLMRTNEKARLFEILNRELHEAQNAIERSGGGDVLLVEPEKKQHMPIRMALGGAGLRVDMAIDIEAARVFLAKNEYDIVLLEESCLSLLPEITEKKTCPRVVLLTNKDARGNLDVISKNRSVNHLISRDPDDKNLTVRYVLTTLTKIFNQDIFGIHKYLNWGVEIHNRDVAGSAQRKELREEIYRYFKSMGIRSTVLDRMNNALEEMLMNAIYDAPLDMEGRFLFNHLPRKQEVKLDSHQQSLLTFASDGMVIAVSVKDPFGALTKDSIINYLLSCYEGRAGTLNDGKSSGAGRGLHQIVESSDVTIFNIKKGIRTEVICLFYTDGQRRGAQPSFHLCFT